MAKEAWVLLVFRLGIVAHVRIRIYKKSKKSATFGYGISYVISNSEMDLINSCILYLPLIIIVLEVLI